MSESYSQYEEESAHYFEHILMRDSLVKNVLRTIHLLKIMFQGKYLSLLKAFRSCIKMSV